MWHFANRNVVNKICLLLWSPRSFVWWILWYTVTQHSRNRLLGVDNLYRDFWVLTRTTLWSLKRLVKVVFFADCGSSLSDHDSVSVEYININVVVVISRIYYFMLNLFLTSSNCTLYLTAWLGTLMPVVWLSPLMMDTRADSGCMHQLMLTLPVCL